MGNSHQTQNADSEILQMIHDRYLIALTNVMCDINYELADLYNSGILSMHDCKVLYSMFVRDVHIIRDVFHLPDKFFVQYQPSDKGS